MQVSPLESYVRHSDTALADIFSQISPHRGIDYLQSSQKDILDKLIAIPLYMGAFTITPLISLLVKTIDEHEPPHFEQKRISGKLGEIIIKKFQTLITNAHLIDPDNPIANLSDKRITPVGRWLRGLEIDEMPQLPLVFNNKLALLGPRTLLAKDIELVAASDPVLGAKWKELFTHQLPKAAIITPHSMDDPLRKESHGRNIPYDLDYMENATLLLDLYYYFCKLPPFVIRTLYNGTLANLRILTQQKE